MHPAPAGTLETVPTDLLRTTLQDGRTEEELIASVERLIPALSGLGYRIASTPEGEPILNTDFSGEITLGLVRDNGTRIDGLVRELRIATPDLIRRKTTLYGAFSYRWELVEQFLRRLIDVQPWLARSESFWQLHRPSRTIQATLDSVMPEASMSLPISTTSSSPSTVQEKPASNSSLKVRLLQLSRAEMSAARLSSSDRARYALKASVMPEDTRFRPDEQGQTRQPTTQEQALFTLDNLMMQSGGARELDGPHALNGLRTLRLAGPARRRFLSQVWDMQEATYAAIGNPYKSASDLLAEDAVFDVAMDAEGRPAAFAILKPSRYGWKGISFGSNGSAEGKQAVHAALARMKTPGYYAELSDAAERSAKRQGVPAVRASMAVTMVKRAKALDDGLSYERGITGLPEPHVKTLYGLPWNAAWETLVATQPAPLAMGRRNAAAGIQNPADQKLVLDSIARHEAGLRELDALLADIVPLRQQFNVLNARWKTIPESDEAARSELRPQIYQLLDQIEAKEKASRSLRRSLNALPDVFVRFGRPPENGRSQNFLRSSAIRQAFEAGVSAFPTLWQDGRWKIVTSLGSEPTLDAFIGEANRHIYLVTGDVVDEGEDNEPVLGNFRVLKELDAAEILPAFYAAEDWDATLEDQPWTPLYMGRKNVSSDGGSDLFSFDFSSSNEGLGLSSLLTPVQQERKVKAQLDLFGGTTNAIPRPRPASPRPAQSARSQKPARAPEAAPDFGELFGQTGLGSNSGGGSGGRSLAGQSGTGQPGGSGGGRADADGGGETGGAGTDSAGEAGLETGADSDMPGVRGDGDASDSDTLVRRPDVGSPERNFEIPADLATIAPATDRAKIQANIEAIRLLKQLEAEGRNPTTEEKRILASYTGWGAFKEAFNTQYEQDIAALRTPTSAAPLKRRFSRSPLWSRHGTEFRTVTPCSRQTEHRVCSFRNKVQNALVGLQPPWTDPQPASSCHMHSLSDLARALNRPTVYISGLQSRFELPIAHGAGYSDAYLALLCRLVDLRKLGVAEERLLELWGTEKKLLQLLHADFTGSATWFLDYCGMTPHPARRLLLSQHDVGFVIEGSSLQMGLNFAETPPELFGGQAMGEDALRILAEYRKKAAAVLDLV